MVATVSPVRTGFTPNVPQTFEDLGISQSLVLDLVLRRLLLEGFSTLEQLSNKLKVSMPILNIVFQHMRSQQLVEVKGMVGNDYHFTLSQAGKMLAASKVRPRASPPCDEGFGRFVTWALPAAVASAAR